ncbi:hypothetical protein AVEN_131365-1 [Araneus ventricosus]|uniref:Uncharacterized protein n=1 Tax=Araneus ventricosus TaxID=182803 RepID=A0A4Y2WS60_ARAVE|nr:hypothetical protein AVEN_261725-1 [Araneus ventricosus]GBO39037.1 hypothetical protein AVEN_131365-1 [Araneus ventricosus]
MQCRSDWEAISVRANWAPVLQDRTPLHAPVADAIAATVPVEWTWGSLTGQWKQNISVCLPLFTFSYTKYTKRKYCNRQKIRTRDFDESPRFRPPRVRKTQFWNYVYL